MWKEVDPDKYCTNHSDATDHDVENQLECQEKCIEENSCVGYSYSYMESKTGWCYLCKDKNLESSMYGFGFYMPGNVQIEIAYHVYLTQL